MGRDAESELGDPGQGREGRGGVRRGAGAGRGRAGARRGCQNYCRRTLYARSTRNY